MLLDRGFKGIGYGRGYDHGTGCLAAAQQQW